MKSLPIVFLTFGTLSASPIVYTFSGNTGGSGSDVIEDRYTSPAQGSGLFWSNGIRYNTAFEYQIVVDFDKPGLILQADGTAMPVPCAPDCAYFYSEYYAGNLFTDLFHGSYYVPGDYSASYSPPMNPTIEQFGVDYMGDNRSKICVKPNAWSEISILSSDEYAQGWKIGDSFTLAESVQNPLFIEESARLVQDVVLTDVSPMAAVPEPSSLALFVFGGGLLVLGIKRRSKRSI